MVNATTGGGSGALIDQLDPLFTEIASLLGELAGNEAAWAVLDGQETQHLQDGWTREPGWFTIPGTYGFETQALYVAMHPTHPDWYESTVTNADRERLVQEAINQVWNDSHDSWANSALPTVYRSASRNVWEPEPSAMTGPVAQLQSLTQFINDQLAPGAGWSSPGSTGSPDWLADLQQHWPATSESSSTFYEFWDDVNDKCGLYLHAAARLASTSAQVAGTISDFQTNLLEATTKARDRVVEALQQWQAWKDDSGAWPTGEMADNSDVKAILGHVNYVSGIIAYFPPASFVAGGVSLVTGTAAYLVPDKSAIMECLQAAKADKVSQGFINDLVTIEDNMGKVLDRLRVEPPADGSTTGTQGFQSYVADVVANRQDWRPLDVEL